MDERFKQPGAFSWCELMTTDVAAAKRFYGELFGWETEDSPVEGMTYTVVKVAGKEMGGIMPIPPEAQGAPPSWGAYVTVDDVDAAAGKVEALGGKIVAPPRDVAGEARFCVFQDPQGACLSMITCTKECGKG